MSLWSFTAGSRPFPYYSTDVCFVQLAANSRLLSLAYVSPSCVWSSYATSGLSWSPLHYTLCSAIFSSGDVSSPDHFNCAIRRVTSYYSLNCMTFSIQSLYYGYKKRTFYSILYISFVSFLMTEFFFAQTVSRRARLSRELSGLFAIFLMVLFV